MFSLLAPLLAAFGTCKTVGPLAVLAIARLTFAASSASSEDDGNWQVLHSKALPNHSAQRSSSTPTATPLPQQTSCESDAELRRSNVCS